MDYKFLLECKNDLFNFLSSMLIIPIYSGIHGMYEYSVKMHTILDEKCKLNNKLVNPGIASILKLCLNDIISLNNYEIENIYNDIKQKSGCYNYFDDLVKACFKSYILLLTYNPVYENSNFTSPELYENIVVKDFIHKCYIEVSNYFKENIELIIKDRKREMYHIIKECIEHSIKKSISNYDEIIKEYLKIKFDISKKEDKINYDNIKSMVSKMINTKKYGGIETMDVVVSGGSEKVVGESSFNNVENFINANKEIDAIVNNKYIDDKVGGGDSTQQLSGKNYILNTQSNEHSTSNIMNICINKDKEIDNILNNNLLPVNEEGLEEVKEKEDVKVGGHNAPILSETSTDINGSFNMSKVYNGINTETVKEGINIETVKEGINIETVKEGINIETVKKGINIETVKEDINTETVKEGTNKTSLLESPLPIKNNKINDILPTVKKGRPPKNKKADKFFNNLV
jgi:hypothetical protein